MWGLVAALFAIASAAAVIVPLVRGAASAGEPETTAEDRQLYACVHDSRDEYCDRISADMAERAPVSPGDWRAAQPLRADLMDTLTNDVGLDCRWPRGACRGDDSPPTPEAVRRAIVDAGFLNPVVRYARVTDPAPRGAIMFAVPVVGACLVGYYASPPPSTVLVVGQLRDGTRCAYS